MYSKVSLSARKWPEIQRLHRAATGGMELLTSWGISFFRM